MPSLLEIISTARDTLPGIAEAEARAAIDNKPTPHSQIFDQLKAQAQATGKDHFTFLGRVLPTDTTASVGDILKTLPQGETEEAGRTARLSDPKLMALANKEGARILSGEAGGELAQRMGKPANLLENLSIAATKSAAAPKNELKALMALREKALNPELTVYRDYQGVLERQAAKRMARIKRAVGVMATSKGSTMLQAGTVDRSTTGGEY